MSLIKAGITSEPAGVRVHPSFVVHLQSSSTKFGVCKSCAQPVLSGKLHNL
jgi:hypothetical protein